MIFSRLLALVAALGAARGSPLAQGLAVGLVGRDCVVLAADTTLRRGATVLGRVTDRITTLAPGVLLATVGDPADARRVSEVGRAGGGGAPWVRARTLARVRASARGGRAERDPRALSSRALSSLSSRALSRAHSRALPRARSARTRASP